MEGEAGEGEVAQVHQPTLLRVVTPAAAQQVTQSKPPWAQAAVSSGRRFDDGRWRRTKQLA